MTWERTAERYLATFEAACAVSTSRPTAKVHRIAAPAGDRSPPEMRFGHLRAMTDDTGLFQHAIHSVPDRLHGYCVDDNARGLLLSATLDASVEPSLPDGMTACYAAFVQHAWNPDTRRFRNFMSFDRRWLEPQGSEDSHGRTLWALGACARLDGSVPRRSWAAALFAEALPSVESFASPRAWAFALLGLDDYCAANPREAGAQQVRLRLAGRLQALLAAVATPDWVWFEEGVSYDNARLCEALIISAAPTGTPSYLDAGLRSLDWLMARQTGPAGFFRPVGTDGFHDVRRPPEAFDQQPIEAAATISACVAAYRATGDLKWKRDASRAFAWFLGANDLGQSLVDIDDGGCCDGLHPDRRNENRGGESVVSYLMGLVQIRQLESASLRPQLTLRPPASVLRTAFPLPLHTPRGRLVASNLSQPAGIIPAT